MGEHLTTTRFSVEGMDCANCATKIDTATRRIVGVTDVAVSVVSGTMTVTHAPTTDVAGIASKVNSLGYTAKTLGDDTPAAGQAERHHAGHDHAGHTQAKGDGRWWQSGKARLTIASALAVLAAFGISQMVPQTAQWVFIVAMLVGLVPIAQRAYTGAINGSPFSIETLMSVAAVGAVLINAAEEAAVVVVLFLVGELLEGLAAERARANIKALAQLVPKVAMRERDGRIGEVLARNLAIGDIVMVRPGDRIPADGVIVSGQSAIDEAPVTGESMPKAKQADDAVFAGTINQDNALRIRVTAAAADNTIARVVALVEHAQESKAPTERFIDRFARYYTPGVMLAAALVAVGPPLLAGAVWGEWIYKGLAILLIGCPCALVISTPAAIAAALSAGARRGLLMKGGAVLEQLGKVDMVALDKTGTLTAGKPQVTDIIGVGHSERETLALAAALETGSNHPLASAILARARADEIDLAPLARMGAVGGKGVVGTLDGVELFLGSPKAAAERLAFAPEVGAQIAELSGMGKTVAVLLAGGTVAGLIAMRDEPRADAAAGLSALRALGAEVVMLTGDNARTAAAIGETLAISVRADLLPQDKMAIIDQLRADGRIVAKVGDGINDAPALAAAHVGIAMGGGTDIALETADAAVLHGRVVDVANMIALSRAAMANIRQNITIALGLKAVFLVTTIVGLTGLWPAILADTGATVLVTANAMRLLGWRGNA